MLNIELIKKMNRNRRQKDSIKTFRDIRNSLESNEKSLTEIKWYLEGVNDRLDIVISKLAKLGGEQDETTEERRRS